MDPTSPTKSYLHSCLVPFHLSDPAGILFFSHVFTLFHQAYEHFVLDQFPLPWNMWFQNPDWILPIKHAEAQYFYPLQAGQKCQLELSVTALSSTSFTLTTLFHQSQLCCSVKTVHVFCRRESKQKKPIPATLLPIFIHLKGE